MSSKMSKLSKEVVEKTTREFYEASKLLAEAIMKLFNNNAAELRKTAGDFNATKNECSKLDKDIGARYITGAPSVAPAAAQPSRAAPRPGSAQAPGGETPSVGGGMGSKT